MTTPLHDFAPADAAPTTRPTSTGRVAVIVNPTKFSTAHALMAFRAEVDEAIEDSGWRTPLWLLTTATSRGADEARAAAAERVDLVLVAGGDGTFRTAAETLAGTGIPLGIVPFGTGNLLARNIGVPTGRPSEAVQLALRGSERPLDLGWIELDPGREEESRRRFAFVMMAGAGFDAAIMDGASAVAKQHLGLGAYLLSGARALARPTSGTTLTVDGVEMLDRPSRGFVVGNFGTLSMGLTLMPEADPSDGLLDTVVLLPTSLPEWVGVTWSVASRRRSPDPLLPRFRGRTIEYRSNIPQRVEVDGDVVGEASVVRVSVERSAIAVRC